MHSTTKTCRECGAEFKRSPADRTVRCPKCRTSQRTSVVDTTRRVETCYCGKTVIATIEHGVRTTTGWACPRECTPTPVLIARVIA